MDKVFEKKYLLAIAIATILAVLFFTVIRKNDNKPIENSIESEIQSLEKKETIKGKTVVSGTIPQGSTIALMARKVGDTTYAEIQNTSAGSIINWVWPEAEEGVPYEIKAVLISGDKSFESPPITVVAPASNEELKINSTVGTNATTLGKISGKIDINGVIPVGSSITLLQKVPGAKEFSTIGSNIQAKNGVTWQWPSATVGKTYEIMAHLMSGGQVVGTTNTLTTTAPASGEVLVMNSQSQTQTVQTGSLSGKIDLNGTVPNNSFISLGVREAGQTTFDVLGTNIAAKDGVPWTWNNAENGKTYQVQAYVQTGSTPIAQSEVLTIAAPATDRTLTINVTYQQSAPASSSLTATCVAKDSKNKWQVKLTMNSDEKLKGIQKYWLKFGTVNNGGEFIDSQILPGSGDKSESITTDYILTENATYYAKYAYENCNCGTFSSFSAPIQVTCKN